MTRRKPHKQLPNSHIKVFAHCWKRVDNVLTKENRETKEKLQQKRNQIFPLLFGSTLLDGCCCCCISMANIHRCMTYESENRKWCHETGTGIREREIPLQLQLQLQFQLQHRRELQLLLQIQIQSEIHWPSMARHCALLFPLSCELIYCCCYWVADVVNALDTTHCFLANF